MVNNDNFQHASKRCTKLSSVDNFIGACLKNEGPDVAIVRPGLF